MFEDDACFPVSRCLLSFDRHSLDSLCEGDCEIVVIESEVDWTGTEECI